MGVKYFKKYVQDKTVTDLIGEKNRAIKLVDGVAGKISTIDELRFNKDVYLNNMEVSQFIPFYKTMDGSSLPGSSGSSYSNKQQIIISNYSDRNDVASISGNYQNISTAMGSGIASGSVWGGLFNSTSVFAPQFTSLSIIKKTAFETVRALPLNILEQVIKTYSERQLNTYSPTNNYNDLDNILNNAQVKTELGEKFKSQYFVRTLDYVNISGIYRNIQLLPDECLVLYIGALDVIVDGTVLKQGSQIIPRNQQSKINMVIEGTYSVSEVTYESKVI